jgi:hypothetical protein
MKTCPLIRPVRDASLPERDSLVDVREDHVLKSLDNDDFCSSVLGEKRNDVRAGTNYAVENSSPRDLPTLSKDDNVRVDRFCLFEDRFFKEKAASDVHGY